MQLRCSNGRAAERLSEGLRALEGEGLAFWLGLLSGRWLPAVVLELRVGLHRPAAPRPLHVHCGVDGDPAQPAPDAAAPKRLQVPVGAEERLLDGVGGLVAVRHEAVDEGEEVVLMAGHELVEGFEPAAQRLLDQGRVDGLAWRLRAAIACCRLVRHDSPVSPSLLNIASLGGRSDGRWRREDSTGFATAGPLLPPGWRGTRSSGTARLYHAAGPCRRGGTGIRARLKIE